MTLNYLIFFLKISPKSEIAFLGFLCAPPRGSGIISSTIRNVFHILPVILRAKAASLAFAESLHKIERIPQEISRNK